jgi:hypothetical protein
LKYILDVLVGAFFGGTYGSWNLSTARSLSLFCYTLELA